MLTMRIFSGIFFLTLSSSWLHADIEPEELMTQAIEGIRKRNLNGDQMIKIGGLMMDLADALEEAKLGPKAALEKEEAYKEPINIPEHVSPVVENESGARQFFSDQKKKRRREEPLNKRKLKKTKLDFSDNKIRKQSSVNHGKRKSVALPVSAYERAETTHGIYFHTIFRANYIENPIEPFDAKLAMEKIRNEFPRAQKKTLEKKLMLEVEKHFRRLMKHDENLIKVVKYIGLCQDDAHRVKGHARDLCDEKKCLSSTKAIVESLALRLGFNIRMHMVVTNLTLSELPLFEALMAQIFPVQTFGASARIADKKAFAELQEYLSWQVRARELKKAGLDTVVEEQTERHFIWSLPRSWWPQEFIKAFVKLIQGS